MSCTRFADIPEPALPNDEWVKIKTRYGGIDGSDTGTIHLHTSPYLSVYASFPLVLGHENVGRIAEVGARAGDLSIGERVVVEPALWCRPRGFTTLCRACARGEINLCERMAEGAIAPGLITGGCRDTGGAWSEFFVAHAAQVYRVPSNVSDENAVLVEPLAVALHAALQHPPRADDKVLIMGAGVVGLLMLAVLRALSCQATIWVVARYPFQADAARRLGASDVIEGKGDYFADVARRTGGKLLTPIIGKRVLNGGGVDVTYECVGSDDAIDDSLRLTRSRGRVVLLGLPGITQRVDWSSILLKELHLSASYIYNYADAFWGETRRTFDIALELMKDGLDLSWLVTHRFRLREYDHALRLLTQRGRSGVLKAVFEF